MKNNLTVTVTWESRDIEEIRVARIALTCVCMC